MGCDGPAPLTRCTFMSRKATDRTADVSSGPPRRTRTPGIHVEERPAIVPVVSRLSQHGLVSSAPSRSVCGGMDGDCSIGGIKDVAHVISLGQRWTRVLGLRRHEVSLTTDVTAATYRSGSRSPWNGAVDDRFFRSVRGFV